MVRIQAPLTPLQTPAHQESMVAYHCSLIHANHGPCFQAIVQTIHKREVVGGDDGPAWPLGRACPPYSLCATSPPMPLGQSSCSHLRRQGVSYLKMLRGMWRGIIRWPKCDAQRWERPSLFSLDFHTRVSSTGDHCNAPL